MLPWVDAHRQRGTRGEKHPVYDFLFTYYSFRSGHLLKWSPGCDVALEGCTANETDWPNDFVDDRSSCSVPSHSFPDHRRRYLQWAIPFLEAALEREPVYHCFGLHEWAMVYETDAVRHTKTPLRVSREQIRELVDGQGLRCTHFDAFRFFTPAAVPLNRIPLTRDSTAEHDQPGCIHANMDLYKFAFTLAPYTSSELLADAFDLARLAREIDMRASPYDLRALGFEPIPMETRDGRELYIQCQKELLAKAQPLRQRVLQEYRRCNNAVTGNAAVERQL
ncbi:hypothetical protein BH11PLA2_BH11PLA2_42140 [soil metagenome]